MTLAQTQLRADSLLPRVARPQSDAVSDSPAAQPQNAEPLKSGNLKSTLRLNYSMVCRLAYALCGGETDARKVVKTVFTQCLRVCGKWRTSVDATNWFLHHTVLRSRDMSDVPPELTEDCLLTHVDNPEAQYIAFLKAFRNLPRQQREAFILFRSERLEPRPAAVAMDCSTQAAANHLIAANKALTLITPHTFDAQVDQFTRVYSSLTPLSDMLIGDVNATMRKYNFRRSWRGVSTLVKLAMLAALGFLLWRLWKMLVI
jgi:DNA-directed RNA polymerase specialized sigma24 family protein